MTTIINDIVKQFVNLYSPKKILVFGSQVKQKATSKSDIDLCVIVDTIDKRTLLTDMYLNVECEKHLDILLYTPEEWENCVADICSFANVINREGVLVYGR